MKCLIVTCNCTKQGKNKCQLTKWRPEWGVYTGDHHICKHHFNAGDFLEQPKFSVHPGKKPNLSIEDLLRNKLAESEAANAKLQEQLVNQEALMKQVTAFLTQDQLEILKGKEVKKFGVQTMEKALGIKLHCGTSGYLFLQEIGFPLPSEATLYRWTSKIKVAPGKLKEVFVALANVAQKLEPSDRHGVLVFDEMALQPGVQYHPTLGCFLGFTSEEVTEQSDIHEDMIADKALVFVLKLFNLKVKQPVAYYFTNKNLNGKMLATLIKDIAEDLELKTGICIHGVVCDMGGSNQGALRELGFGLSVTGQRATVPHWKFAGRRFFAFCDATHLIKNLRNMLEKKKVVQTKFGPFEYEALDEMVAQSDTEIKVSGHRLTAESLHPKLFQIMRVWPAVLLFSEQSAGMLDLLGQMKNDEKYSRASSFIKVMSEWWKVVASTSSFSTEQSTSLSRCIELMESLDQSLLSAYPSLRGIIFTSKAIMDLDLMLGQIHGDSVKFKTANLLSDCVENVFSQVRSRGNTNPTPVLFNYLLKAVILCNHSRHSPKSPYEDSGDSILLDLESLMPSLETEALETVETTPQADLGVFEKTTLSQVWNKLLPQVEKCFRLACPMCVGILASLKEDQPALLEKLELPLQAALKTIDLTSVDIRQALYNHLKDRCKLSDIDCADHEPCFSLMKAFVIFRLRTTKETAASLSKFASRSSFVQANYPNP